RQEKGGVCGVRVLPPGGPGGAGVGGEKAPPPPPPPPCFPFPGPPGRACGGPPTARPPHCGPPTPRPRAPAARGGSGGRRAAAAPVVLGKGPTQQELLRAGEDTQSWLYATKDYTGQRFVNLRQITPKNASQLRPVCIFRSEKTGTTQTNPIVYKGVIYGTRD